MRKPRRTGSFARIPKQFTIEMLETGTSIEASGLLAMMLTDPGVTALGYVYRKHEWEDFPSSNSDTVDRLIEELEAAGHLVSCGPHIVIRDYMRRNAFELPSYLRSGLYDLRNGLSQPLLRFVIGTQFLQVDSTGWDPRKASSVWQAASPLWREITGGAVLPPIHQLRAIDAINTTMVDSLVSMPQATTVLTELNNRDWVVVPEQLRQHLRVGLERSAPTGVITLSNRRAGRSKASGP